MTLPASYAPEIAALQLRLLRLAEAVDRAIIRATWALAQSNPAEAQQLIDSSARIDTLRYELEEAAIQMLSQPHLLLPEIRAVSGMLLLAGELKRIGDYARGIATLVVRGADLPPFAAQPALGQMAHGARDMLQRAIRAVIKHDPDAVSRIAQTDSSIDQLYQQMRQELLAMMRAQPEHSEWATYILWAGHNLERIADRAVTIAERAAFIATGTLAPTPA